MENKRTVLAIALIILVWSGYSLLFPPQPPPPPAVAPQVAAEPAAERSAETFSGESRVVGAVAENMQPAETPKIEKKIRVESDLYLYELTTDGARLRRAVLKKYKEENKPDAAPVNIVTTDGNQLATFRTSGNEGLSLPADTFYALQGERTDFRLSDQGVEVIRFVANSATGLEVHKSYTFHADSYQVDLSVKLINRSSQPSRGSFDLSLINYWDESREGDTYNFVGPTTLVGEKMMEDDPEDLQTTSKTYSKDFIWSGFLTKYFATLVSPQANATKKISVEAGDGYVENRFSSAYLTLEPGESISFDYVAYLGPKDYDLLKATGHQFDAAIDLGFFSIIAQPLMIALKFFHGYLGNWGFAIILLTVCIKALFWPLTQKSYSSMKAMQKLQPKMAKLREKYANDKQRLNTEMMTLYKENRVNPFGGCLPILIQIPVFFALYQVLLRSIELRHAPFMWWITDLSAKDPYYVTPLIMGVTMFLQQKMTPTTMDPMQARLMMMMPVVFTFLFLNFPSGLVIYWLVNNVLTIAQQYLINRKPA
jgi:YidC/Oxa1 family membrane protein insertase